MKDLVMILKWKSKWNGSQNPIDDPSGTTFIPNKTADVNLNVSKKLKQ